MAMGFFITCINTPLLFYPFLLIILFLFSLNHHYESTTAQVSYYSLFNGTNLDRIMSVEKVERGLVKARIAIRKVGRSRNFTSNATGFVPIGSVYRNSFAFHQSHIEMQKRFKVWTYKEGEPPLFHSGPLNDIYSIEGQFIDELDNINNPFHTHNPHEAVAFFLPISVVSVIRYVYRPYTNYSRERLQNILVDYVRVISQKYPYWNRSKGGDHFFISCHDWAPDVSAVNPDLFRNFIRVLCNANTTEGFKPNRDVSLPEIYLPFGTLTSPHQGQPPQNRSILAFFAGGDHGEVRESLFRHWKEKDNDIQVHAYLPKTVNYTELMGQSKYCLCPSGYEVASPRVVESIHAGCVPVIISDNYVPPFSDVLNWSKFSVHISIKNIPKIKSILKGISMKEYLKKQKRVIQIQRHFVINRPSKAFDLMHMVMHSVWLRRLNIRLPLLK